MFYFNRTKKRTAEPFFCFGRSVIDLNGGEDAMPAGVGVLLVMEDDGAPIGKSNCERKRIRIGCEYSDDGVVHEIRSGMKNSDFKNVHSVNLLKCVVYLSHDISILLLNIKRVTK